MTKNPFQKLLRSGEGKKLRALEALVPDIGELEAETKALSDDELKAKTPEFKQRVDNGEGVDDLLIEAFAVVREAAWRVIGQRHYDVQLIGGAALHFGWVAEMKTGEGKTLTSTLPIYLNAMAGKGVHVVTVNDYLASRDAEWMGEIYGWLGLGTGLVTATVRDNQDKRAQYDADITYGTNNELGFDYLRDNMAMSTERKVQRGHNYCIVDEIDSILIDEARTPLIISGRLADAAKVYYQFASIVRGLRRDDHYDVDEEKRTVAPTEEGIHAVERALGIENLYDSVSANLVHQFQVALKGKELFHRDKDYIVVGGEVKIVDEFTGRILEGRRWSDGLHQAVEAKEGVKIKEENQTLATITLQNYFRLYDKLAGMTGTAETEASEFYNTYGLQVVPIPTNKPVIRDDQVDLIYRSEESKFGAVVDDILERHSLGQPILAGTISVDKSELLSGLLTKNGIEHSVLNAKLHSREADVVAQAGRLGAVTVATNMAGRGVDIVLGGNAEGLAERDVLAEGLELGTDEANSRAAELTETYQAECDAESGKVKELGGLYVVATERHDSRRIDNQLRGRCGRQGDPGATRFYLSLEDELMRLFATGAMDWVMKKALPDDVAIDSKMVTKAIERAQNTVEQRNAEIRKNVLKYDEVMNEQRRVIYARRGQILDGADLRDEALEYLAEAVDATIGAHCVSDYQEEWDLEGLATEVNTLWPNELSAASFETLDSTDEMYESVMGQGVAFYEEREAEIGADTLRQIERQVMLRIIDQRWREHLYEMDYLKEGIHLRAMGQKDPLTEWQREGFEMFGTMMSSIAQDFVRYVTHIQVNVQETPAQGDAQSAVVTPTDVQLSGPDDQGDSSASMAAIANVSAGAAAGTSEAETAALADAPDVVEETVQASARRTPVVKSEMEKTPRNAPCPCGSGKKYKQCHGR